MKDKEDFWIFDATYINCRKLTKEELDKIQDTKKEFYKNLSDGKYKTLQQLDAEMNIGNFYCKCMNSGVNSFTGMCSNCGMSKPSRGTLTSNTSGDILKFESEISAKKIETVEELISSTPNDQELGEKIRKLFG